MKDRLLEVLSNKHENYIMPFLWMHGGNQEQLRETMGKIREAGVTAICVESRPHPDFVGPGWWADMDAVMQEARQHKMKVWLLDDQFFPSGCAAGKAAKAPSALRKWSLVQDCIDVPGPQAGMRFAIGGLLEQLRPPHGARETTCEKKLIAVVACRCDGSREGRLLSQRIDLTARVDADGFLRWDVPEGAWRLILVAAMTNACLDYNSYVNFLHGDSVKLLLDAIYEPHFERYRADFGKTFAGFFNDEPGFYTGTTERYPLEEQIGQRDLPLPFAETVFPLLFAETGFCPQDLPLLWYDSADGTGSAAFRGRYMDALTRLYQQHYTQQVGDWCEQHGVEYIGHVLEDNNSHTRLGCGAGHYFRAMLGQHMSGIDVVFNQIYPGRDYEETCHRVMDGEFNHYALAKLASSCARLEPRMQGRAMAEVFGAGGWAEGLSLMKWVADSLLVRGINTFVPHAYSPKDFPDADCPPHFYAQGNDPQYPYMHKLYSHMNRAAHLLHGGRAVIHTALLYHAQAEWHGDAMPVQAPARVCLQHQIDFDIVSEDHLLCARPEQGGMRIGESVYRALVIPAFACLPRNTLQALSQLAQQGVRIVFLDTLPVSPDGVPESGLSCCPVRSLQTLAELLASWHCKTVFSVQPSPGLRCLHYRAEQQDLFFVFNELVGAHCTGEVCFPVDRPLYVYDCMENRLSTLPQSSSEQGQLCHIHLAPYESLFFVTDAAAYHPELPRILYGGVTELCAPWSVCLKHLGTTFSLPVLRDIASPNLYPDYSGAIEYQTKFIWDDASPCATLDLGQTYEAVEAEVNGISVGVCICPPYHYRLDSALQTGENTLTLRVATTLFNRLQDPMSLHLPIAPTGVLGPVTIRAAAAF